MSTRCKAYRRNPSLVLTTGGRGSDAPRENYTAVEKSRMPVQDPPKGNDVDANSEQARQLGAIEVPLETYQQPELIVHNIIFWRNGFTVNDGSLRSFEDPENAPFLKSIRKDEFPKELDPANKGSSVHVNVTKRDVDCPKRPTPFQGSSSTSEPASEADVSSLQPSLGMVVDQSLPSTSILLRLTDGTRMVAHFNYNHTVAHIRSFIDASRPRETRNYQLQMVGFPPKVLTDPNQTIEQAGLLNSVVIQKL